MKTLTPAQKRTLETLKTEGKLTLTASAVGRASILKMWDALAEAGLARLHEGISAVYLLPVAAEAPTVEAAVETATEAPAPAEAPTAPVAEAEVVEAPKPEYKINRYVQNLLDRGYADTGERFASRDDSKAEAARLQAEGKKAAYFTVSTSAKNPSFGVFAKEGSAPAAKAPKASKLEKRALALLQNEGLDAGLAEGIRQGLQALERAVLAAEATA